MGVFCLKTIRVPLSPSCHVCLPALQPQDGIVTGFW